MTDLIQQLDTFAADSPLQELTDPFSSRVPIRLYLKRDDRLHPQMSGNKWRKLKYNLLAARAQDQHALLTFGGAYSNHLYATAAAGRAFGFRTIGVVRGDELASQPRNTTLTFCESCGMHLHFISRADYRRKDEPGFLTDLTRRFGPCYILPEGGSNQLALQGTAEIMPEVVGQLGASPDYVACAVGTGSTLAGMAASAPLGTKVLGVGVLTAAAGLPLVRTVLTGRPGGVWQVVDYALGGYAKTTPDLLAFIQAFERKTGVLLEPVYTGKLLYGLYDLARQGYFSENATVVAVHTGGLQGRISKLKA